MKTFWESAGVMRDTHDPWMGPQIVSVICWWAPSKGFKEVELHSKPSYHWWYHSQWTRIHGPNHRKLFSNNH